MAQAQAPDAADMCSMLVQSMQHVPGWDDKNFQVRWAHTGVGVIRGMHAHV